MYELLYIIPSNLDSEDIEKIISTVESLLKETFSAEIIFHKIWLKRKLSYSIKRVDHGHFVLCYFKTDPKKMKEINKELRLNQQILRHVIVSTGLVKIQDINNHLQKLTKEIFIDKDNPSRTRKHLKEPKKTALPPYAQETIKKPEEKPPVAIKKAEKKVKPKEEKFDLTELDKKLDNILEQEGISI